MRRPLILIVVLTALMTKMTFAELVSRDDAVHGANSITLDTVTGLQWLDVTKTNELSFTFVSSQLGPGGMFEGFRYATIAELTTLFTHAGIPHISFGPGTIDPANYAPVLNLIGLLGATNQGNGIFETSSFLGDAAPFFPANQAVGMLRAFPDSA